MMTEQSVFLALPAYGAVEPEMMFAVLDAVTRIRRGLTIRARKGGPISLLARNFNQLWCKALNHRREWGLTHFLMLHGDVVPEPGWVLTMLDEMDRLQADVLSAIVPIKDHRNLTSTAILNSHAAPFTEPTKLSVRDLAGLPLSFDASAFPGNTLLANTGLLLVDFTKPWVENVWFEIDDRILRDPDGTFRVWTLPEDWNFSLQAAEQGARVFVTQILSLGHFGRHYWYLESPDKDQAAA